MSTSAILFIFCMSTFILFRSNTVRGISTQAIVTAYVFIVAPVAAYVLRWLNREPVWELRVWEWVRELGVQEDQGRGGGAPEEQQAEEELGEDAEEEPRDGAEVNNVRRGRPRCTGQTRAGKRCRLHARMPVGLYPRCRAHQNEQRTRFDRV